MKSAMSQDEKDPGLHGDQDDVGGTDEPRYGEQQDENEPGERGDPTGGGAAAKGEGDEDDG